MAEEEVKEGAASTEDVKEGEVVPEDRDEKDVPWKNRAKEANRKLEARNREYAKLQEQQDDLVGEMAVLHGEMKVLKTSPGQTGQQYQYTVDDLNAVLDSEDYSEDQKKIARQELRRKDDEKYQQLSRRIEQSDVEQKRMTRMQEVTWTIKGNHPHLFPTDESGNPVRADDENPHVQAFGAAYRKLENEARKQGIALNPDDIERVADKTYFALSPAERAKLMGASTSDEDEDTVTDTHLEGSHVPRGRTSQPVRLDEDFIRRVEERTGRKMDRKSLAARIEKRRERQGRSKLGL